MVVLLDLLTSTQPHMIPRSETADLERWEERSKPLVPVDHARKGDPPQLICMNTGQGRSKPVLNRSSFSNKGFYSERPDSIERPRYGPEIEPPPLNPESEMVSPQSGESPQMFCFPSHYPSSSCTPSPTKGHVHSVPVVVHHPGTPMEARGSLPSPYSNAHSLQTLGVPLQQFDLDYSFENEAFFTEPSVVNGNAERFMTPCSTPSAQRLSVSTDMSFHTALDDLTDHDIDSMRGPAIPNTLNIHNQNNFFRPISRRCPSPPNNLNRWHSPTTYPLTEKNALENHGCYNHRERVSDDGSRRPVSEIHSKEELNRKCKQLYGEAHGGMGVDNKNQSQRRDQNPQPTVGETRPGNCRFDIETSQRLNGHSKCVEVHYAPQQDRHKKRDANLPNGQNIPKTKGKQGTSPRPSTQRLAQYSTLYDTEVLPLTSLPLQGELADPRVYYQAPTVNAFQTDLSLIQKEDAEDKVWFIPTITSDTVYRIPELNIGRSTFV